MSLVEFNNLHAPNLQKLLTDVRIRIEDTSTYVMSKLTYVPVAYSNVDDIVRDVFSSRIQGIVLAGGAARSCVDWFQRREKPRDYDFFFESSEASDQLEKFLLDKGFDVTYVCPLGKLTSMKKTVGQEDVKVQLIKDKFFQEPISLISSFDFSVTMFAISADQPLMALTTDLAIYDTILRHLRINKLEHPLATINRVDKYLSYEYKPVDGMFKEIAKELDKQIQNHVHSDGSMTEEFGRAMRKYID